MVDLITQARVRIIYIGPSIHEELLEVLLSPSRPKTLIIKVCIDNDEKVYRNGYGNFYAIEKLSAENIEVRQVKDLRIGLLSVDNDCWLFAPESRIINADANGPNAVMLPNQFANELLQEFFLVEKVSLFSEENIDVISESYNLQTHAEIAKKLDQNPPVEPDLQRQINTYSTFFQFVELHFEGANVASKSISIPSKILPFKDEEIKKRMKTKFNLFTEDQTKEWTDVKEIRQELEVIKKEYLTACSLRKDKSVLSKSNKLKFEEKLKKFEENLKNKRVALLNEIQQSINQGEDTLRSELKQFYSTNLPDSAKDLRDEMRESQIDREVSKTLNQVRMPSASDLVSKLKLSKHYYELTWEDLSDKALIAWFKEKGIIPQETGDQIADMGVSFDVKK